MQRYTSPYVRFLKAAEKTGDITLRWWYQHQMMANDYLNDAYIDRIADRVIQRISLTADVSEII